MRYNFMLLPGLVLAHVVCIAQAPCVTVKIQTAAVDKPTDARVSIINDCREGKISWKGKAGQTYLISINNEPQETYNAVCDKELNCQVILPIRRGQQQQYSITAVEIRDHRIFYSYPRNGALPACYEPVTMLQSNRLTKAGMVDGLSPALQVYPNPVTGELVLKWKSAYQGPATISIIDATGKKVQQHTIRKTVADYLDRITAGKFSPGIYFLKIQMPRGEIISTRFIKQ